MIRMGDKEIHPLFRRLPDNPGELVYKQHQTFSVMFVQLNTLNGAAKILTMATLDFSTLSCTNLQILNTKRYDEHPH